ncbi:unnamed protein product [marine sediment metagenome]|uniref:Uncharacterized protein n=1 Tax=marine sediment metagenome TaxID=412755 RepID=X0TEI5_9ZZZZ
MLVTEKDCLNILKETSRKIDIIFPKIKEAFEGAEIECSYVKNTHIFYICQQIKKKRYELKKEMLALYCLVLDVVAKVPLECGEKLSHEDCDVIVDYYVGDS